MRENRLSGLMRGGKQTVIGPRASQSVASRLLYTPNTPNQMPLALQMAVCFSEVFFRIALQSLPVA